MASRNPACATTNQIMREILSRFSLDAVKLNAQVYACAIVLYLVVMGCALHSIHSQRFNQRLKLIWTIVVLAVPIFGLAAYAVACVLYAQSESALMAKRK